MIYIIYFEQISQASAIDHVKQNTFEHISALTKQFSKLCNVIGLVTDGAATNNKSILERVDLIERSFAKRELSSSHNSDDARSSGAAENDSRKPSNNEKTETYHEMTEKVGVHDGLLIVLNREMERIIQQLDEFEIDYKTKNQGITAMNQVITELQRKLAVKDAVIVELQLKMTILEQTSYDGILMWKITDFNQRRQDALSGRSTSFYSIPFYTSRTGKI